MLEAAILVVAPEASFRRSLGFLLEAEGWRVGLLELLPTQAGTANGFNCMVVDDTALPGGRPLHEPLAHLGQPVVLLVDRAGGLEAFEWLSYVEKPLFGPGLVGAVHQACRRDSVPT